MEENKHKYISFNGEWLGDVVFTPQFFEENVYSKIKDKSLLQKNSFEKHREIGEILLKEIQSLKIEFLLPAIIDLIVHIRKNILHSYTFSSFELFLENYSGLSEHENYLVRGRIVGRYIPRSEYQIFFPIGMGGNFIGSHFSVAHFSPDIDTVIASFHGFLDAFAAKIGQGVHYWQVPSGPPKDNIDIDNLFIEPFGAGVFETFLNSKRELTLSALDLYTQKDILIKKMTDRSIGIDHNRETKSVVVINDEGDYISDWRSIDYDEVRMVINNFITIFLEFERSLYILIVNLLLKGVDSNEEILKIMDKKISDFLDEQMLDKSARKRLDQFIMEVLGFSKGIDVTLKEFLISVKQLKPVYEELQEMESLKNIEAFLTGLHKSFSDYFSYLDTFEVGIAIKRKVLKIEPVTLSHVDGYSTIIEKMNGFSHLTVVYDEGEKSTLLGVIHASKMKKDILGTVSIRDFSNNDEMDRPSYIDIISCIDHHKSEIKTSKASRMIISDAQSSNSIVASLNMMLNEKYSSGGYTDSDIDSQLKQLDVINNGLEKIRITKRLLSKKEMIHKNHSYYISSDKEFLDYYHFLFAILDDTDLLTKVTCYDIYVVKDLLNKMKSLMIRKEVEVVNFDDLQKDDPQFVRKAADKLLQTHDLYSVYSDNHQKKEKSIERILKKASSTLEETFFQDTKVIGKYAQVGQFKMFSNNHHTYHRKRSDIKKQWLRRCNSAAKEHDYLSIFIFMVTTVDSAEDLFAGVSNKNIKGKDELWVTCLPNNRDAYEKTRRFLSNLLGSPKLMAQDLTIDLSGTLVELEKTFSGYSSNRVSFKKGSVSHQPFTEIYVNLKSIQSRKSDISPYI